MPTTAAAQQVSVRSQAVTARLTRAAIFLTVGLGAGVEAEAKTRQLCADLSSLVRGVGFRAADGGLSCILGIGADAWDRLFGAPRPRELHRFREINGVHHAPATPGDLLIHIRAARTDLCFELATQIMSRLAGAATVIDEVHGFRYFDDRDLLGFVDGTENPVDQDAIDATVIGAEDPAFAGGSYVITQKYLHDLDKWNALTTERQEEIIGRKKLSDVDLSDDVKKPHAHNVLNVITDADGNQLQILRDNMPFGRPASGEFGTYFIGYSRSPSRTILMLRRMFIGAPEGNYDRILDVSTPVTGTLFFTPTADMLDACGTPDAASVPEDAPGDGPADPDQSASLGIGSLKGR